ncbi:hypothetical protein EDC18_108100 [Natranaerovirga pectinivora]|uniref:CAAX prenyl protease 2/Lysostaphin resistance protein A-like domain-containing protein n=1 Tax=Natranaerovirga pectinivora TaxID=682400 RepID=A0A4V2V041_9FIRM|nr:type II CAAX endopeptidase family protein [Natranaerovirga pectinivora]TCT13862.1 hypothetical protein EDC18_108100 [Natranaerovirga pectinivora]
MKLLKAVGFLLLIGLFYMIATAVVAFVMGIVGAISGGYTDVDSLDAFLSNNLALMVIGINLVTLLFIFILFSFRKEKSLVKYLNFSKLDISQILYLLVIGIALNVFINVALMLIPRFFNITRYLEEHDGVIENLTSGNVWITLFLVIVIAPIFEEILCRGVILKDFMKSTPVWVAVIIQSLVFGFIHGNIVQGSYAFVIGLVLAVIYLKMKSIWAPIFLHFVFNFVSLFIGYFIDENMTSFLGIIYVMVSFVILAWFMKVVLSKEYPTQEYITQEVNEEDPTYSLDQ